VTWTWLVPGVQGSWVPGSLWANSSRQFSFLSLLQDPTSLIGGEVVMGAPITDQDEEAGDLRDCMDLIGTYLEAAEEEALV
jgi:hypothetical protein